MATYRFMAFSIQEEIKQTFDDASVDINQIIYWIDLMAKRARYDKIRKNKSDAYLVYFPNIIVKTDTSSKRKYAVLPAPIADLDNDTGIKTITYCNEDSECFDPLQKPFSRTTSAASEVLYGNPFRKPTSSNVYFFRSKMLIDGSRLDCLIFLGLECVDIDCLDMWLYSSESTEFVCDLDQQIDISPEMEKIIYYEVLNLAKFGYLTPTDKKNDGSDTQYKIDTAKGQQIAPVYRDGDTSQQSQQQYNENSPN